jgi:hypothetical protein
MFKATARQYFCVTVPVSVFGGATLYTINHLQLVAASNLGEGAALLAKLGFVGRKGGFRRSAAGGRPVSSKNGSSEVRFTFAGTRIYFAGTRIYSAGATFTSAATSFTFAVARIMVAVVRYDFSPVHFAIGVLTLKLRVPFSVFESQVRACSFCRVGCKSFVLIVPRWSVKIEKGELSFCQSLLYRLDSNFNLLFSF